MDIKKMSGLSINPDIHHSKVFSSDYIILYDSPRTANQDVYALTQKSSSILPITHLTLK